MTELRAIPASMEPTSVARIDGALAGIEAEHEARILLAIESGSRAWGFPSPDSDYDCRFLFLRPTQAYLSPWPPADHIELPLVDELDVNGWDLGKALKLLLKGNAVVIEWLTSPIVYRGDATLRSALIAFASRYAPREGVRLHYLHLGEKQRRTYFADDKPVPLKKLFYALRPAAALRWLRLHPRATVAPMHFPTVIAQCEPPQDLAGLVAELIARKSVTRELGEAPLPAAIARFVDEEFENTRAAAPERAPPDPEGAAAAETLFRDTLRRLAP